jgi:hypothetical protein
LRAAASLVVLLAGCATFVPESVVTKLRVLAVQAEPPEVAPGQTVRLEGLVTDPEADAPSFSWLACDPVAALSPCDDSKLLLDRAALLEAPGVRRISTSSIARTTFSSTGTAIILLIVDSASGDAEVIARKEVTISRSSTPNHNPTIEFLLADSVRIDPGQAARAPLGGNQAWVAIVTASSAENYQRLRPDGSSVAAIEDLRYEWFTTAGRFGVAYMPPSIVPIVDLFVDAGPPPRDAGPREGGGESSKTEFGAKVTLNLPDSSSNPPAPADGRIDVWVVVRDERGGTTWAARSILLR